MLTHDHCYDVRLRLKLTAEKIQEICFELAMVSEGQRFDKRDQARGGLVRATKGYAQAAAAKVKAPAVLWSDELVDRLLDFPDRSRKIMREYDREVYQGRIAAAA